MSLSRILLALQLVTFLVASRALAVKLNSDGGYDIVIGVQDGTPIQDPAPFLYALRGAIQIVSNEIWRRTSRHFFINSVKLVVPRDWSFTFAGEVDPSNVISFHTADVRLSNRFPRPRAVNHNLCGRPGDYIELPGDFFADSEPYGTRWKGLLKTWASYRWGVWEEHGYPGSDEFPYYYREAGNQTEWEVGACSNTPLVGSFVRIGAENDDQPCQTDGFYSPGPYCRFNVSDEPGANDAESSLMNFHWLETNTEFCNESSHNIHVRNKQNLFCGYKSVSEVILESVDYKQVDENELVDPPTLELDVVNSYYHPLLYILLDNGISSASEHVIDSLKENLEKFIMDPSLLPRTTIASLHVYPGTGSDDSFSSSLIPWSRVGDAFEDFVSEIQAYSPNSTEFRDFSRALLTANNEIQNMNSFHGGVVLIIKTGAKELAFNQLLRENDVTTRLLDANVNVFAVEMPEPDLEQFVNLEKVASLTNGDHLKILNSMTEQRIDEVMNEIFLQINAVLEGPQVIKSQRSQIIFKGVTKPDQEIELPILPSNLATLRLHLTTGTKVMKESVTFTNGPFKPILFSDETDWSEGDVSAASVLTTVMGNPTQTEPWTFEYSCISEVESDCEGLLVLYGDFKTANPANEIQVEIATSAIDNEVDFSQTYVSNPPFSVYAKILNNGRMPLKNLEVAANIIHTSSREESAFILRDNGLGSPDLYKNDGVYSGYIFPLSDGQYELLIAVSSTRAGEDEESPQGHGAAFVYDDSQELPLPDYQVFFGCANGNEDGKCDGVSSNLQISKFYIYGASILVNNLEEFDLVPTPSPILDLSYWTGNDFNVYLTWTSPFIIGNDLDSADAYEIRYADTPATLLEDFDSASVIPNSITPASAGEAETFSFNANDLEIDDAQYYAIRAVYHSAGDSLRGKSSNIIGILPTEHEFATTTTTESTEPIETTTLNPEQGNTRGYDIVLGIDESTAIPENVAGFINEFWDTIEAFSSLMFAATHHHFYVRSAELVVPASWNFATITSSDSYQTAHVRVSPRVSTPRTDNPNPCGEPGSYIELPFSFFSDSESPQYGSADKALLHLWARYRWGVWEEHGYPGSTKFPYFYKRAEDDWQPVGCSDKELEGQYLNLDGEDGPCENDGEYSPGPECRFHPFPNNTATSSLMYLSSLDSVVNFCTAETHNKETPNKQNMFCQHKSTWEIIESSPDFNTGEEMLDILPPLSKKVTEKSARPLFYVLLDRGRTSIPEASFTALKQTLSNAFDQSIPNGCVSGIGSFPNPNFGIDPAVTSIVTELMPWTHANISDEAFKSKILNYAMDGPTFRDFGLALYDTVNNIKAKKHTPGTILVVLKLGSGRNFGDVHYEEEIIAAATEAKIKLFVAEVQNTVTRPNVNLVNLVNRIGGRHISIRNPTEVTLVQYVLLPAIYNQFRVPLDNAQYRVIHKSMAHQDDEVVLRLNTADLAQTHISLTTSVKLNALSLAYDDKEENIVGNLENEWGEESDGDARFVYNATVQFSSEETELTLKFSCPSTVPTDDCAGFLIIYGLVKDNRANPYNIQVTASSREISYANDVAEHYVEGPFHIFAKVERSGRPMKNLDPVKATIYNLTESWTIDLEDNGFGTPDVYSKDGVYSGTFVPTTDGVYRVFVTVSHSSTKESAQSGDASESHHSHANLDLGDTGKANSRLLPFNQLNPGCSIGQCNAIDPVEPFVRIQDLQYSIVAQGFANWDDQFIPARISNLKAWAADDFYVNLYWTSPPIYRETENNVEEELQVDGYEIYFAEEIDTLLGEFSGSMITLDSANEPGVEEFWQESFLSFTETYFIGVRGKYKGIKGAMSNIVKIITRENETITTTPIPTTTPEEPTEEEISTLSTTLSTTIRTTTTTTTRTPIVTSEVPTTEGPDDDDSKSWIQKPEAYWTIAGFGILVVLIAGVVAAYMFFRSRCSFKGKSGDSLKQRLVMNPVARNHRV